MGKCDFPEHHGKPGTDAVRLAAAAVVIGVIVMYARVVLLALGAVAVLAVVAGGAVLMFRSARSVPYDAAWAQDDEATPAQVVHQHLHLHGVTAAEAGALAGGLDRPAIEQATTIPYVITSAPERARKGRS